MKCTICSNDIDTKGYTVIRGRDVCLDCVDVILRLMKHRLEEGGPVHVHDWTEWLPANWELATRSCRECNNVQRAEWVPCADCGVPCIELETSYALGHTAWVPMGDWENYDPCSDENGLPRSHSPI